MDRPNMSKIVNVSEMMPEWIERFKKMEEGSRDFFAKMREQLAQIDPEKCIEHEEVILEVDEEQTIGRSWKPQSLVVVYKNCPKCDKALNDALVNETFYKMGIPDKVIHATLNNFSAEDDSKKKAVAKVQRQVKIGSGFIVLRGTPGTGKTHLAAAVLKHYGGIFVTEADLIGELRQTYVDNSGSDELVEKYRKAKILVLDELTIDVVGKDIPALLYRILGDRYDKNLLTVITSNETLETILGILGPRLTDRLRANHVVVTCEWESYRKKK